jgi:hypothetical protein
MNGTPKPVAIDRPSGVLLLAAKGAAGVAGAAFVLAATLAST